jgi:acyl dehydratase
MSISGYSMARVGEFVGQELGVSQWTTLDQARIEAFAACTGDCQWIHVDVERAKRESPFGDTVAHGFLTLSLIASASLEVGLVPEDAMGALNYGLDKVRFMTPVKVGSRVRDRIVFLSAEEKGAGRVLIKTQHTLLVEGEEKPALVADALTLLMK